MHEKSLSIPQLQELSSTSEKSFKLNHAKVKLYSDRSKGIRNNLEKSANILPLDDKQITSSSEISPTVLQLKELHKVYDRSLTVSQLEKLTKDYDKFLKFSQQEELHKGCSGSPTVSELEYPLKSCSRSPTVSQQENLPNDYDGSKLKELQEIYERSNVYKKSPTALQLENPPKAYEISTSLSAFHGNKLPPRVPMHFRRIQRSPSPLPRPNSKYFF